MPKKVIIIGAGGHAKVIAEIIKKSNDELVGFLDDNEEMQGQEIYLGAKVIGKVCDAQNWPDCEFIIGIGNNSTRKRIAEKYQLPWYTAIHPNSVVATDVKIGEGTVVMPGVVINPGTEIGTHCIINTSCSIDHDNKIGNFVHISPGAHLAGTITIGTQTWICAGATIINNLNIAPNNIIGAGAVVVKNIETEDGVYIGVPAKRQ